MNSLELQAKLAAAGIQKSEQPFTIETLGTIAVAELTSFTSKSGNTYLKAGDYLIGCKPEILQKAEVTIKVIVAIKDFKKMKAGDKFAVAE